MSTTINRRPYSVALPSQASVKNYFFNHNEFKGIVEDRNFLQTDPETFSDANNVYTDAEGLLRSRPSLHTKTLTFLSSIQYNEILDYWEFDNLSIIWVKYNNSNALYGYNKDTDDVKLITSGFTFKPIVIKDKTKIVVFNGTDIIYYDGVNVDNVDIYVPVTEIVSGDTRINAEAKNVLTTSYRTRYIFTSSDNIRYNDFVDKKVTVTIDNESYNTIFRIGTEKTFVRNIGKLAAENFMPKADYKRFTGWDIPEDNYPLYLSQYGVSIKYTYQLASDKTCTFNISMSTDGVNYVALPSIGNCTAFPRIGADGKIYALITTKSAGSDSNKVNWTTSLLVYKDGWTVIKSASEIDIDLDMSNDTYFTFEVINEYNYVFDSGSKLNCCLTVNNTEIYVAYTWPGSWTFTSNILRLYRIGDRLIFGFVHDYTEEGATHRREIGLAYIDSAHQTFVSGVNDFYTNSQRSPMSLSSFGYKDFDISICNGNTNLYNVTYIFYRGSAIVQYLYFDYSSMTQYDTINYMFSSVQIASRILFEYNNFNLNAKTNFYVYWTDRILYCTGKHEANMDIAVTIRYNKSYTYIVGASPLTLIDADYNIYSSTFNQYHFITIDVTTEGANIEFKPSHYAYLSEHYFSVGNTLFVSSTGLANKTYTIAGSNVQVTKNENALYLPETLTNIFDNDITYLHHISSTEMAVFFEKEVYYTSFDNDNGVYRAYKSMQQVGLKEGNDVITTFDTKYVIFSSQRGLVAMSYQEFIATTEQALTFMSDTIHDRYNQFNTKVVKLYKYDYWIIVYHIDDIALQNVLIYDLRNNAWWPWTVNLNLRKLVTHTDSENKMISNYPFVVTDKSIYTLSKSDLDYHDDDKRINWYITSQRLPFVLNYYKHIQNITLVSMHDMEALQDKWTDYISSIKLRTLIYRKKVLNGELEQQSIDYPVNIVKTYVERLNYAKVEEFQYQLSNDEFEAFSVPLSLSNITIKYRIGSQVR